MSDFVATGILYYILPFGSKHLDQEVFPLYISTVYNGMANS